MNVLKRAEADLEAGRPWKARDRLTGALLHSDADQKLLNALGSVYWEMKDKPAAGRIWFLVDRDDEEAVAARAALFERHGGRAQNVLRQMNVAYALDQYPPAVRARLQVLIKDAAAEGYKFRAPKRNIGEPKSDAEWDDSTSIGEIVGITIFLALTLGVWLFGAVSGIRWLIGLL